MSAIPICVWDFTLSVKKTTDEPIEIIRELEQVAKKWTFQKEKGFSKNDYETDSTEYDEDYEGDNDVDEYYSDDEYESDYENIPTHHNNSESFNADEFEKNESGYISDEIISNKSENDNYSSSEDEESDGYIHYQGRFSLMKKKRKVELLTLLRENNFYLQKAHFSPTQTNTMGNMLYVMKVDTRIEGPWCDTDEKPLAIPYSLRDIILWDFQQEILDRSMYCRSNRTINAVYCPDGNSGKTTVAFYAKCHKIMNALIIPPIMDNFLDLNQAVLSQCYNKKEQPELLFLDIPRALPKNKMNQVLAFCEQAKAYVFDTRYKYTELVFLKSPEIWIFVNTKIWDNRNLLSNDRWKVWTIKNRELFLYKKNGKHIKGEEIIYPEPEPEFEEEIDEENDEEEDEENDEQDEQNEQEKLLDVDIDIVINPSLNIQANIPC